MPGTSTHCELISFAVNVTDRGSKHATIGGVVPLQGLFTVTAKFQSGSAPSWNVLCSKCGYRQYIKGYHAFKTTAADSWRTLPPIDLSPGHSLHPLLYYEDGWDKSTTSMAGHRFQTSNGLESWPACGYELVDAPGIDAVPGFIWQWSLDFRGEAIGYQSQNPIPSYPGTAYVIKSTKYWSCGMSATTV